MHRYARKLFEEYFRHSIEIMKICNFEQLAIGSFNSLILIRKRFGNPPPPRCGHESRDKLTPNPLLLLFFLHARKKLPFVIICHLSRRRVEVRFRSRVAYLRRDSSLRKNAASIFFPFFGGDSFHTASDFFLAVRPYVLMYTVSNYGVNSPRRYFFPIHRI